MSGYPPIPNTTSETSGIILSILDVSLMGSEMVDTILDVSYMVLGKGK